MIFRGQLNNGKLNIYNRDKFDSYLRGQKNGEVSLELIRHRLKRSVNQNAYYWGVVIKTLADHFGYFPEEMHDALKCKFLIKGTIGNLVIPRSTADLYTDEFFKDYVDRIVIWAAVEHEITVEPPPEKTLNFN